MTLPLELEVAVISAAVSLAIVLFKEFWLDPHQQERTDKILRKRMLNVWVTSTNTNSAILKDQERAPEEHLVIDDRPLDILTSCHEGLVDELSSLRSRIIDYNRSLDIFDSAGIMYLSKLQRVTPLNPSKERDEVGRLKWWMSYTAKKLEKRRTDLQTRLDAVKKSLNQAILKENDC